MEVTLDLGHATGRLTAVEPAGLVTASEAPVGTPLAPEAPLVRRVALH